MLENYVPVLTHVIIAVGFASVTMVLNLLLGRAGRRIGAKDISYECGMIPEPGPQPRFSVKFYLVAMLFILFDIEVVFMYPWAVVYRNFVAAGDGVMILLSMFSFIIILLCGFLYAVRKGALDWSK